MFKPEHNMHLDLSLLPAAPMYPSVKIPNFCAIYRLKFPHIHACMHLTEDGLPFAEGNPIARRGYRRGSGSNPRIGR
jgi:hypothetical protein